MFKHFIFSGTLKDQKNEALCILHNANPAEVQR